MEYLNNISNEDIDKLETTHFTGRITVISHPADVPAVVKQISKFQVVGFDTETKPSFTKGTINKVALIQLAIPGEVFIFRINKTGLSKDLIDLFENPEILKVGVSIRDDLKKLREVAKFNQAGFLELQEYSNFFHIESNSLKKLAAIVLGIRISKSQRLTNWEAPELTEPQLIYAATDAWVCLEVYLRLSKKKKTA
jgi:ribonuclease D